MSGHEDVSLLLVLDLKINAVLRIDSIPRSIDILVMLRPMHTFVTMLVLTSCLLVVFTGA